MIRFQSHPLRNFLQKLKECDWGATEQLTIPNKKKGLTTKKSKTMFLLREKEGVEMNHFDMFFFFLIKVQLFCINV